MELKHALIKPDGRLAIRVMFNPTQYSIDKGNQIAEAGIPGLEAPVLQYIHGNTRTLSMDLFFDTYEEQTDVRDHTNEIYDLLGIDSDTHVPPICRISWGNFEFRGVMDKVSGKFTLFLADGTPVRATLSVTFKEFIDVRVMVRRKPTHSADHRKTRVVRRGDSLSMIAFEEYQDAGKWRPIADANSLENPRQLEPGRRLVIPALDEEGTLV
jgi:hypothetical protein